MSVARSFPLQPRVLLLALVLAAVAGCRSAAGARVEPVAQPASAAFARARAELGEGGPQTRARARAALNEALAAEPGWLVPRRALDDLAVRELRGPEALAVHLAALERDPNDVAALYLAGRLEGRAGQARFERALELDPREPWVHHALAQEAARRGRVGEALARERTARARARDPWERSYFAQVEARLLAGLGDLERAHALLVDEAQAAPTRAERDELRAQLVLLSLAHGPGETPRRRVLERGLELVRSGELGDATLERLVRALRARADGEMNELALASALAQRPPSTSVRAGALRDRLRAEVLLDQAPTPLALALLERALARDTRADAATGLPVLDGGAALDGSGVQGVGDVPLGAGADPSAARPDQAPEIDVTGRVATGAALLRAARFAALRFEEAVEGWRRELPRAVLDERGNPRDARLAAVCAAARRLGEQRAGGPEQDAARAAHSAALATLGEAALDAGWFREARAVAGELGALDLERGLALETRALAGLELVLELQRIAYGLEAEGDVWGDDVSAIGGVDALLDALAPAFARAHGALGGEGDVERVRATLAASPRMSYGPIGTLVHPGPWFSDEDERLGRGPTGAPVPGLAAELDRLNRFGLFGAVFGGGGPDATVMTRLDVRSERGEHLGVAWSGTVVYGEGADVLGRASRAGARISGAALHEGYWIDVEEVRYEHAGWEALRRRFTRAGEAAVRDALDAPGLALSAGGSAKQRARARRDVRGLLGEGDRVRLALLAERASPGELLGRVDLDLLLRVTAEHEQGHLTDRARFLPLSKNLGRALGFLTQSGLTPSGLIRRLEYRAQLVALCVAEEPRIPLAQMLDGAEAASAEGSGATAHAEAYLELCDDLLVVLDEGLERGDAGLAGLDPDRTLVHQLHRLAPETLRALALEVARRAGM